MKENDKNNGCLIFAVFVIIILCLLFFGENKKSCEPSDKLKIAQNG